MATAYADAHGSPSAPLLHEQHMQRLVRTITGNRWRQRLAPLAEHMGNRRMIRARSDRGAALALLDLDTLQAALMRLVQRRPSQGYLIVRLAVKNAPADVVAAETGLNPRAQVAAAQAALAALALQYERVAFAGAVEEPGLGVALRSEPRLRRLTRS